MLLAEDKIAWHIFDLTDGDGENPKQKKYQTGKAKVFPIQIHFCVRLHITRNKN